MKMLSFQDAGFAGDSPPCPQKGSCYAEEIAFTAILKHDFYGGFLEATALVHGRQ